LRIFTDRSLIEIFVNGESAVTSFRGDPAAKRKPSVVTEGKSNCREFKVWKM
ncbi:MAG: GH32 C-terminal domain-containing protein, partial [Clostridia bacterium]|nr:GH32 C-terminal domain-containing protein [Clostridia bacterium]